MKEGAPPLSDTELTGPSNRRKVIARGHKRLGCPGKVQDGRRWFDVGECECECVEVQGAPEGRAPGEITFRSLLTKDTYAEPNDLQCNPSSDSSAQKSSGKALGRR